MEIKLNLASKPYLNRQRVRLWLSLACAFMALLLATNSYYLFQNYQQLQLLEQRSIELEQQAAEAESTPTGFTDEAYAAVKDEVVLANEIIAMDQFHWTSLLSRFEELLPEDVSLTTIQPNFGDHTVRLAGNARNLSAMTEFIDNLLTSEDMSKAFLQQHAEVETDQPGSNRFQISFSLMIKEAF